MVNFLPYNITFVTSSSYYVLAFAICSLGLYVAYRWVLPRPISGIPYNKEAAKGVFGDGPALMRHAKKSGEMWSWIPLQLVKLNSPIIQLFVVPFSKPWVVIADFRESQDILLRRTKEFDRGDDFEMILSGITPHHHIIMKSNNPEFKAHRRLIQDLMTPAFLNGVSAPRIHSAFTSLFKLWAEKARLADGHPFSASEDFYTAALDAIWAVTFPYDLDDSVINAQLRLLAPMKSTEMALSTNINDPATFTEATMQPAQRSILTLTDSLEVAVKSPLPKVTHWLLRWLPYMRKARAAKEEMITHELEKGMARFSQSKKDEQLARCAMDDILHRELVAAEKENRKPVYNTRAIYDELFGLLIAGHDTTSTTSAWGLKLLSNHQEVQRKLREAVQQAFPAATAEGRWPSAQEITKARIPYLDATQEEIIRMSMTATGVSRVATTDCIVLGHKILQGTNVYLMSNGPGYVSPPVGDIPEELRSESCRASKTRVGSWDPEDSHLFKPERWLTTEDGNVVFDSTAGPLLTFGLGPRGCFGRRMAYLELKIALVLLVWNFELLDLPSELNSNRAVDRLTHQPQQCFIRLLKI